MIICRDPDLCSRLLAEHGTFTYVYFGTFEANPVCLSVAPVPTWVGCDRLQHFQCIASLDV